MANSATQQKEVLKCRFCGHTSNDPKVIDWEGYRDRLGHDTVVPGCKDIDACTARVLSVLKEPVR
jgi:hypothetical protein